MKWDSSTSRRTTVWWDEDQPAVGGTRVPQPRLAKTKRIHPAALNCPRHRAETRCLSPLKTGAERDDWNSSPAGRDIRQVEQALRPDAATVERSRPNTHGHTTRSV